MGAKPFPSEMIRLQKGLGSHKCKEEVSKVLSLPCKVYLDPLKHISLKLVIVICHTN